MHQGADNHTAIQLDTFKRYLRSLKGHTIGDLKGKINKHAQVLTFLQTSP